MANSRYYSSTAQQTTLSSGISPSNNTMIVAATTGFPGSFPYTLAVDYGAANEELVEVTGAAGTTLSITRAIDGTSSSNHNPGAVVRHVSSARDFTDSRTHEAASAAVHGLTGTVVGTSDSQTLTNKTLTRAQGSMLNATFYNTGATGITEIVGDSTNPNASRLEIKDNEVALNTMIFVQSTGNIKSVKNATDADNTYKFRLTDNDGTTDRFAVLGGGTVTVAPTNTTTFVAYDAVAPASAGSKRMIRVAGSAGANERFTVWDDGRVAIVAQQAGNNALKVTAAATPTVDVFNVSDSTGTGTLFAVQSTGLMNANKGALIAQPGVTSGAVLQVGGSNLGYTGNLQQWVGPSNSIVAQVTEVGDLTWSGAAWSTYSPSWTATTTNPVIGNGTIVGRYKQYGKTVVAHIDIKCGSTTTFGSGAYSLTLPVQAANQGASIVADIHALDTTRYGGQIIISPNATLFSAYFPDPATPSQLTAWNSTTPKTWTTAAQFRITFMYESV